MSPVSLTAEFLAAATFLFFGRVVVVVVELADMVLVFVFGPLVMGCKNPI